METQVEKIDSQENDATHEPEPEPEPDQEQQPQEHKFPQWHNVRFYIKSFEIKQGTEGRKKPFALYTCAVTTSNEEWEVKRRYNEFFKLHKKLQRRFRNHQFIHFPRKRVKGNLEPKLLEKRKRKIGLYIQDILNDPDIVNSEILHQFLTKTAGDKSSKYYENDDDDSDSDDAVEPPVAPDDIPSPKVQETSSSMTTKPSVAVSKTVNSRKSDGLPSTPRPSSDAISLPNPATSTTDQHSRPENDGVAELPRHSHSTSIFKNPITMGQAFMSGLREEFERRRLLSQQQQSQQQQASIPSPSPPPPPPPQQESNSEDPSRRVENSAGNRSSDSSDSSVTILSPIPVDRPPSSSSTDSQPVTSADQSPIFTGRRTGASNDAEPLQISDFYLGGDPKLYHSILQSAEDNSDDIEYFETSPDKEEKEIRAATLDKIVEILTSPQTYDSGFLHTVMITYRSFTSPNELFDKLVQRWNYPPPVGFDNDPTFDFEQFKRGILDRIRLRVTQTIKFWLENFYTYDFDESMLEKLHHFIENVMMKSRGEKMAGMLRRTRELCLQGLDDGKVHTPVPHPAPLLPSALTKKSMPAEQIPFLEWPMKELARQICIIDFEIFSKIQPKECLNQSWTKESRQEKAPNIYRLIQWFNSLSQFVGSEVVIVKDLKARTKALRKMIELAKECRDLNDFNAVFALVSGLNVAAVHRLRKTWDGISKDDERIYEDLNVLISRDKNFKAIRTAIKTASPPCVPYIGNYLTDLLFIEEGHPKLVNKKINVIKCTQFATVIRDIKMYQNSGYEFDTVPALHDRLIALQKTNLTEDQIYEESLLREERVVKARPQ